MGSADDGPNVTCPISLRNCIFSFNPISGFESDFDFNLLWRGGKFEKHRRSLAQRMFFVGRYAVSALA
jgi:hypothetical protein